MAVHVSQLRSFMRSENERLTAELTRKMLKHNMTATEVLTYDPYLMGEMMMLNRISIEAMPDD